MFSPRTKSLKLRLERFQESCSALVLLIDADLEFAPRVHRRCGVIIQSANRFAASCGFRADGRLG